MLLYTASSWLPRLSAVISVFFGLVTLHYFYFPNLPHLDFDIKTENLKPGAPNDTLATIIPVVNVPPTERWPIRWIPEKHWQIWRVNIADFEPTEMERMRTWRHLNQFYRYEVFSHESAETFVRGSFLEERPDIVNTFFAIKDMIIRADFLRYLILYREGGVYSDIDTKALKPISTWIPEQFKNRVNALIGLEIDEPGVMWGDWADNFVFCQSTLMVSPGHRIYEILISNILRKLDDISKEQSKDIANLELTFQDVLKITGPVAFTDAVLSYFTETMGETITRTNFTGINIPKNMADVLVMPTVSFVPGQPHSRSGKVEDKEALVQHMGMGSWRDTHKLESTKHEEEEKEKERIEQEKKQEEERLKQLADGVQGNGLPANDVPVQTNSSPADQGTTPGEELRTVSSPARPVGNWTAAEGASSAVAPHQPVKAEEGKLSGVQDADVAFVFAGNEKDTVGQ